MKTKIATKTATPAQKSAAALSRNLADLKLNPRTFAAILRRLSKLASPKLPLKGRGYAREAFPADLTTEAARIVFAAVPYSHKDEVCFRRTGGYFGASRVISPEAAKAITPFSDAVHGKYCLKLEKQIAQSEAAAKASSAERARKKAAWREFNPVAAAAQDRQQPSRSQVVGYLDQAALTDAEREELRRLVNGQRHPFTGRALELKAKSGLTWGQLAN